MAPPSGQKVTLMTGASPSVSEDLQHSGLLTWLNSQTPGHALRVRSKHLKGLDLPQTELNRTNLHHYPSPHRKSLFPPPLTYLKGVALRGLNQSPPSQWPE